MDFVHDLSDFEFMTILGEGKRVLSIGGWGCVRLCKSKSSGRYYAVKIMSKQGLIKQK